MPQYRLTPNAEKELDDIWHYIISRTDNSNAADKLIGSILDAFMTLGRHPFIGRARDDDLKPGLRSLPVGEYMILYRVEAREVVILRVLHGKRNIQGLLH